MGKNGNMKSKKRNVGDLGEQIISNFFDVEFSEILTFPDPKTQKNNAQIADVLIWVNRVVFLIEVKTRDIGPAKIESWASSRINDGIKQLIKNYQRIKTNEKIKLHNKYYDVVTDFNLVTKVIGIIVLVCEENLTAKPSSLISDIYNKELPIHVFLKDDLIKIKDEIDTYPDLKYYLNDRYEYLKMYDIHLGWELNAVGYYKMNNYKFPSKSMDFSKNNYWQKYKNEMSDQIISRSLHNNEFSIWIDKMENIFNDQRKLFQALPLGLIFAWELGNISRRERAYFGEKLSKKKEWFAQGNNDSRFSIKNSSTGNWLVFYFSIYDPKQINKDLEKLVRYKLMILIEEEKFNYSVYGFGFKVSNKEPYNLLGMVGAIIIGADEVKNNYSREDLLEAYKHFGGAKNIKTKKIKEFL